MLVHFEMVDRADGDLAESSAEMNPLPRKGESIIIGTACYLINDVIWSLKGNQVTFLLIRRAHPL